jgi:hypothetical protein
MGEQPLPSPGRICRLAALSFGGGGFAIAAALLALWGFRTPLAEWVLDQYFASRSAPAQFDVDDVGLGGITLHGLHIGRDASAQRAQAMLAWSFRGPRLSGLVLQGVEVRGRLDQNGLSLGALDRLRPPHREERPVAPALRVDFRDVTVQLTTPLGLLSADLSAQGELRGALSGTLRLHLSPREGPGSAVNATLFGDTDGLNAVLSPEAGSAIAAAGVVQALWSLEAIEADLTAEAARLGLWGIQADAARVALAYRGGLPDQRSAPFGSLRATMEAARLAAGPFIFRQARLETTAPVATSLIGAPFTLRADQAQGLGFRSGAVAVEGAGAWSRDGGLSVEGEAQFAGFGLTRGGRERLAALWLRAQGTPLENLSAAGLRATLETLSDGFLNVPFGLSRDGAGLVAHFPEAISLRGGNGRAGEILPREAAILRFGSLDFAFAGDARLGGLALEDAHAEGVLGGAWRARGTLAAQIWRSDEATLSHNDIALAASGGAGDGWLLEAEGDATASGPVAGGYVTGLETSLRVTAAFARNGSVTVSQPPGCAQVRFARLETPLVGAEAGAVSLCPEDGVWIRFDPAGRLAGGFRTPRVTLTGAQGDDPAQIAVAGIDASWSGTTAAPLLSIALENPSYALSLAGQRSLRVSAKALTADAAFGADWSAEGTLTGVRIDDNFSPVSITEGAGLWSAAPMGAGVQARLREASARMEDRAPPGAEAAAFTPRFNPFLLAGVSGALLDGTAQGEGGLVLAANGQMIGAFSVLHDFEAAEGSARLAVRDLSFGDGLQPLDLTEYARGAIIHMDGSVSGEVDARWTEGALITTGQGRYALDRIALPAAPDIRDVTGTVTFDDLLAFSTPPGQEVQIGVFNPGVALENGAVRYQLLPQGRIALEAAQWAFASGVLTLDPTLISLGQESSMLMLRLSAVDASAAAQALQIKDLLIEGEMEGVFPLLLTPSAAIIVDGTLEATAPGRLAYVGPAGDGLEGMAQIAFDALRDFRYQALRAILNGDLAGDIDVELQMEGLHSGEDLDLSAIIPLSGARATADDVPFQFDISIHAPFRDLVETGAGLNDARRYLPRAIGAPTQEEPAPAADPSLDPLGPAPP